MPEQEYVISAAVYDSATERIKALIRSRRYGPGDKLPSERVLADDLGISRNLVREALRGLVGMGILETRPGSGTIVARSGAELLAEPVEFLLLLDRFTFEDLIEAREALEPFLAERAARRRTEADLAEINTALEQLKHADMATAEGGAAHRRFHNAVAQAAHSPLVERLLSSLLPKRSAYVQSLGVSRHGSTVCHDSYSRLADAVRAQDAAAAQAAMHEELQSAWKSWDDVKSSATEAVPPLPGVLADMS